MYSCRSVFWQDRKLGKFRFGSGRRWSWREFWYSAKPFFCSKSPSFFRLGCWGIFKLMFFESFHAVGVSQWKLWNPVVYGTSSVPMPSFSGNIYRRVWDIEFFLIFSLIFCFDRKLRQLSVWSPGSKFTCQEKKQQNLDRRANTASH